MNERDFVRLEEQLQESWLIRVAGGVADTCVRAVDRSTTAQLVRGVRERFLALPGDRRVRAAAAFAATAAIGHLLLLRLVPAHIAPALPRALWITIAVAALVVAAGSARVTRAWQSSAVRDLWIAVGRRFPESRK